MDLKGMPRLGHLAQFLLGNERFQCLQRFRDKMRFYTQLANEKYREPEMYFLKNLVSAGATCLDIGANVGEYTYVLSVLAGPKGKIYAIEPIPWTHERLNTLVAHFHLNNVNTYNMAIGDRDGTSTMWIPLSDDPEPQRIYGLAHLPVPGGNASNRVKENVMLKRLSSFVSENSIKRIDFIKCDVEGAEFQVFGGEKELIKGIKPIILCEIEGRHLARYGQKMIDVFSLFHSLQYVPFYLSDGRLIEHRDFQLNDNTKIVSGRNVCNFFLIPNRKTDRIRQWR